MKKKVINLKYYSYWKAPFTELINNTLHQKDINKLHAINPYIDCISYYDKAEELLHYYFDSEDIERFFDSNFTHVIGYHATKLNNENVLKVNGMKTFSKNEYLDISRSLFGDIASDKTIESAVNQFTDRIENMKLEFSYFKDSYLDDFRCLYLIYGSETLLCIANIINGNECRKILRERNIPLIYRCEIPISYITDYDKESLFKIMFSRALRKINSANIQFENTWCFELNRNTLESKYVKKYEIMYRRIFDLCFDHCEYQYAGK